MAQRRSENPLRIALLARSQEKGIAEVDIPCNFCGLLLPLSDKVKFDVTHLNLLWKPDGPKGICQSCVKAIGYQEFCTYYEGTFTGAEIQFRYGCTFVDLNIRCQFCMRLLSDAEKSAILTTGSPVHRVRGLWKSRCIQCS
nr:TPA_asm: E6 [Manis javanica papillomavirus 1]